LKKDQHGKFMEKKIKRAPKGKKTVSDRDEEKTIALTILVAVVILAGLIINLSLETPPKCSSLSRGSWDGLWPSDSSPEL